MSKANNNTEVFPDLHHKMSKKIAQLTKVYFYFNDPDNIIFDHFLPLIILLLFSIFFKILYCIIKLS